MRSYISSQKTKSTYIRKAKKALKKKEKKPAGRMVIRSVVILRKRKNDTKCESQRQREYES